VLQSGCGEQGFENSNRWEGSPCRTEKEIRQKERISFKMERVESVTFHKRRSGYEFKGLCKDGYVYNLEIEDNHNYFVNDILVHNCHRCPSTTWTETLTEFPARFYLGLSATPFRRDGLGQALNAYIGHKIHKVDKNMLHSTGAVLKPKICLVNTEFKYMYRDDYPKMISALCKDNARNELIARSVCTDFAENKQNILIVSDRKSHCKEIANSLRKLGMDSRILSGTVAAGKRTQIVEDVKAGRVNVLIATLSLVGEGFDAPNLCSLFLTTPVKFSGRLIQVVGRILRPEEGKIPRVYDFRDNNVTVLKHSGYQRNKIYQAEWG
jgi:superfamily II DNA or RNA helicase